MDKPSSSPARLKRYIAYQLTQMRKDAGFERPEVATRLGISKAAVGHLETARNLPSKPTLEILLNFYGHPEQFDFLAGLVEAARKGKKWWAHLSGAVPDWFDEYLGLEGLASELSSFDAYLIPGLLQTRDYAAAVVRADPDLDDAQVEERVELRTGRQSILERESSSESVRLWVVLDESVLYRRRGTNPVMAEQIHSLLKMSERPRIDIQVLPLDAGAHLAQQGSFQLMKFPAEFVGDPGVAYVEALPGGRYYETAEEIAEYERAFTRLQVVAANQEDSRVIMHRAAKEMAA